MNTEVQEKLQKWVDDTLLTSDKPLNASGIGTGAMIAGFVGTITGYEFGPVQGARTVKRNNKQTIKIGAEEIVLADKGDDAQAFYMVFEGGSKRVTTTLLEQHPSSFIVIAGEKKYFSKFVGADYGALKGKTIKCDYAAPDEQAAPIMRLTGAEVNGAAEMKPKSPMEFRFTLVP